MNREKISEACSVWLAEAIADSGKTRTQICKNSGVSKQNISRILNKTPSKDGTPPVPSPETMIALAKELGKSESEALSIAGYRPEDFKASSLIASKAAEIAEKLPTDKAGQFIEYGEHLVKKYAITDGQKRVRGAKAPAKPRKATNSHPK